MNSDVAGSPDSTAEPGHGVAGVPMFPFSGVAEACCRCRYCRCRCFRFRCCQKPMLPMAAVAQPTLPDPMLELPMLALPRLKSPMLALPEFEVADVGAAEVVDADIWLCPGCSCRSRRLNCQALPRFALPKVCTAHVRLAGFARPALKVDVRAAGHTGRSRRRRREGDPPHWCCRSPRRCCPSSPSRIAASRKKFCKPSFCRRQSKPEIVGADVSNPDSCRCRS